MPIPDGCFLDPRQALNRAAVQMNLLSGRPVAYKRLM
jgi:hypothetical protein